MPFHLFQNKQCLREKQGLSRALNQLRTVILCCLANNTQHGAPTSSLCTAHTETTAALHRAQMMRRNRSTCFPPLTGEESVGKRYWCYLLHTEELLQQTTWTSICQLQRLLPRRLRGRGVGCNDAEASKRRVAEHLLQGVGAAGDRPGTRP